MDLVFVCTHNAGRSQMAEAFAKAAEPELGVASAGIVPGAQVNPKTCLVMREIGLDLSSQSPKLLQPAVACGENYLVVMGPEVPLTTSWGSYAPQEIWDIPNPQGMSPGELRGIREQIRDRVKALLLRLMVGGEKAA